MINNNEELNNNQSGFNIITDDEFDSLPGDLETQTPQNEFSNLPQGNKVFGGQNLERLKLSFGDKEARQKQKDLESAIGLRGDFEMGDIADIVGDLLPFVGGVIGGTAGSIVPGAGTLGGAALGTMGGEAIKDLIGQAFGVRKQSLPEETKNVAVSGLETYLGGKLLGGAWKLAKAKVPGVQQATTFLTRKLPERLFSTFFKTTADDMEKMVSTGALARLQKEQPQVFDDLIKAGYLRINPNKQIEINPTLAQQALERNFGTKITGRSLEKMAEYSYLKQFEIENNVRKLVTNLSSKGTKIDVGEYKKAAELMLDDIVNTFKEEGYGIVTPLMRDAQSLLTQLKSIKGTQISPDLALRARRILDSLRSTSSFRINAKLAPRMEAVKTTADKFRAELAKIPELKDLMTEYKFFIDSADDLVSAAAKAKNTRVFTLFDALVGGTSLGTGAPFTGIGLMSTLRTVQTPAVLTALARGLYKSPDKLQTLMPYLMSSFGSFTDPLGLKSQGEQVQSENQQVIPEEELIF